MAAENNGLSNPFAKVLFSTQCQVTKVDTTVQLQLFQILTIHMLEV